MDSAWIPSQLPLGHKRAVKVFFFLCVLWNYPLAEGPPTKMADVAFQEFRMASSGHNPDPGTPLRTTAAVEHKHFQVHNPDALLKGHGSEDTRNEIPSKSLTSQ